MSNKGDKKKKRLQTLLSENKRVLLIVEISVGIISIILAIVGKVYSWNEVLVSIFDDVFTACLLAAVGTLINWGVKDEYENTISVLSEDSREKIEELSSIISTFKEVTNHSAESLENASQATKSFLESYLNRNCLFCKTCLIDVYPNRASSKLDSFFSSAQKEICILVTNLDSIRPYIDVLLNKAKQGIDVKLCTIDPRAARAFNITRVTGGNSNPKTRFDSMRSSLEYFIEMNQPLLCDSEIEEFKKKLHNKRNALQIRTYAVMPTTILFIADNECIVSFMLNKTFSRDTVHLHINIDSPDDETGFRIFSPQVFKNHFDSIFCSSSDVSDEIVEAWEYKEV